MNSLQFQISSFVIGLIIGTLYYMILARNSKSNKLFFRTLCICAIIIFVVHSFLDAYVISEISVGDLSSFFIIALAFFHSLELFVFQTHFFDNGYQEFFFGKDGCEFSSHPWLAYLFVITFILAAITSVALVIKAINRRRAGLMWLSDNKDKAGMSHVFFLGGKMALTLAEDIKKHFPDNPRIFVGYPDPEEIFMDLSIWEKIKKLFKSRTEDDLGPFDAIVYSRIPLSEAVGTDICSQMNLKDLELFLKNHMCKVYLLSDDEKENLHCAEILYRDGCTAEIFCRACREGVNRMYEDAMTKTPSINVHLVDSSYLAVRNIKNCQELLPVNYVEKGIDKNGYREGWVDSAFNSMILGFGETGREALGFLYEHAAFVDRDFKRSPFSCVVMDRQMGKLEQAYRKSFPGMNESVGVFFKLCEIGSNEFWLDLADRIQNLNYIVICLGDDRLNLYLAVEMVEYAFRHGKDLSKNFVILVAQEDPTHLDNVTLNHYNQIGQYHNCIRTFGDRKDVWTYDNMTNESIKAKAKSYFAGYMRAQGDTRDPEVLWNQRDEEIETTSDYAIHAQRVRQRSQDYANCFHVSTKLALIGPEIYDCRRDIAKCIPADFKKNPIHYTGADEHAKKVLHYLAVHEHIRWEASHVAMGYTPGKVTDEVLKTHVCIMSYDDLTPEVQHYDYLVVKTTFEI
ncbi:MAG: hypothetical protein J6W42_00230 [Bacteroidaceae bacterium]|nr:hypothetical protein [Bacteroidaceae bacterium]